MAGLSFRYSHLNKVPKHVAIDVCYSKEIGAKVIWDYALYMLAFESKDFRKLFSFLNLIFNLRINLGKTVILSFWRLHEG